MLHRVLAAVLALAGAASGAQAQSFDDAAVPYGLDEVRLGIHAHSAYHTLFPLAPHLFNYGEIRDLSVDLLFETPDHDVMRWLGSPRPLVGTTINFSGKESLLYAALNWHWQVFDTPIFLEGTFGAALNNGYLDDAPPGRPNLGCRANFYEVFGIGTNIGDNFTATLTYEHTSNANLCEFNNGLSNFGVRVGYKF